jgi:hypothetical protein
MVLISKYSNCGNEVGNSMKSLINYVESPLLDQQTPNSFFKLLLMIFQIGLDFLVYGHFSMVLVDVSSNLPH